MIHESWSGSFNPILETNVRNEKFAFSHFGYAPKKNGLSEKKWRFWMHKWSRSTNYSSPILIKCWLTNNCNMKGFCLLKLSFLIKTELFDVFWSRTIVNIVENNPNAACNMQYFQTGEGRENSSFRLSYYWFMINWLFCIGNNLNKQEKDF